MGHQDYEKIAGTRWKKRDYSQNLRSQPV